MKRRNFLKRITGYSLALTGGGLALPHRAKCEIVKPFAEIISNFHLDKIIRKNILKIKKQSPNLSVGETHCHSYFSDGSYTVKDLMLRSASLGLDFLVITEHLTPKIFKLDGCLESILAQQKSYQEWSHKKLTPPDIYPAFEISAKEGHIIAVFPREYFSLKLLQEIKRHFMQFYYHKLPVENAAKLIREMGGVSIIPHPNIARLYSFGISSDYIKKNLVGIVDAIEDISTGHGYQKKYSKEIGLASIGSSDDHFNILLGTAVTCFDHSEQKNLIQAIHNHNTHAVQVTNYLDFLFAPTKFFFNA